MQATISAIRAALSEPNLCRHVPSATVFAVASSQKCSECNYVSADNRKTQAEFVCIACGYNDHADINASKNIKAAGSAVLACGGKSAMAFEISPLRASAQESPPSEARVSG